MSPRLLPFLPLSLAVIRLGRGQDPAGGGVTGDPAAGNSREAPAAPANRIGPQPTFADLAYANQSPAEKLDL
jgi:hypothetical protein